MPSLRGFIDLYGGHSSFLIPVFVDRPGSNRFLIQQITPADTIGAFTEFDAEITYDYNGNPLEVEVGQKALWAFRFQHTSNIVQGSSEEILGPLRAGLTSRALDDSPMTKNEVANFCKDSNAFASSVTRPFQILRQVSPLSAELWRDAVVLLPLIKRELGSSFPTPIHADMLASIRATGVRGQLIIELPSPILKAIHENDPNGALPKTKQLARMFDLGEIVFSPQADSSPVRPPVEAPPFAIVQSFNAIGDRVIGRSPSSARRSLSTYPLNTSGRDERALTESSPPFAFAIISPNADHVVDAKVFATSCTQGTIKVAIVVLPTSFGTRRKSTLDVFQLTQLRETFDYTFIIGNHILRKPRGVAPSLTAFGRGVALVQACIRGLIQLGSHYGGSVKDIRSRIGGTGVCLVGRFASQLPLEPSTALRQVTNSMLSENIPLEGAERLVVMGTGLEFETEPNLFYSRHIRSLLPKRVHGIKDVLSFRTARRGSWHEVICLAFSIDPKRPNPRQFLLFCKNLVTLCGWTVSDWPKQDSVFVASDGHIRILVGGLVQLRDADDVMGALSSPSIRGPRSFAVVLTNFTPSGSFAEWFGSKRIRVVHYSHFERLAGELDLSPRARR